jgi:glucose/arabinose dehydrogenase
MSRSPSPARLFSWAAAIALLCAGNVSAQLRSETVVTGLSAPVAFVQDPGDASVQYVVQQGGVIRVVRAGVLQTTPFLNLSTAIASGGERGLLGMALPADSVAGGRFFVYFTNPAGDIVVARFRKSASANPLTADPASRFDLRWSTGENVIRHPTNANHNGGTIAFGPDGYLYIGVGDGGSGNDPPNNAQNMNVLLGKMLRIDVSVPDTHPTGIAIPTGNPFPGNSRPEIWDIGLRNPFKWSFDDPARGGTGALIIGDVGQNAFEEIDYEPAGRGGNNYGWRNREGAHDNVTSLPPALTPLVDPIFEYGRTVGTTVTGGYVYRGTALGSSMRGRYFFADFSFSKIWSLALTVNPMTGLATASDFRDHTAQLTPGNVSSFGTDAAGELYFVEYGGTIKRIASAAPVSVPLMSIDSPLNNAVLTQPFAIGGWAINSVATGSAGISTIHVWAYPLSTGGNPIFAGVASLGISRPDVGAAFGSQFANAGFQLPVSGLVPGDYLFAVYAMMHATGTFDIVKTVNVRIRSSMLLAIDAPAANSTVDRTFLVGGWAINTAAASGIGIDALHVWALDPSGSYSFIGAVTTFSNRADVGTAFGAQFTQSGYTIIGTLPSAGNWFVLVYPHNALTGQFEPPVGVPITVR